MDAAVFIFSFSPLLHLPLWLTLLRSFMLAVYRTSLPFILLSSRLFIRSEVTIYNISPLYHITPYRSFVSHPSSHSMSLMRGTR
jgi:hypothetical protein